MKMLLVSVKDELRGYGPISMEDNEATALRNFTYACNNQAIITQNCKHFSLYKVGTFDTELGVIEECVPALIIDAGSCIRHKEIN